jgi:two-component system phosphate regulon response regulator PhoB
MSSASLILIVDDEEDVRELVAGKLRRAGFETAEAGDGVAALKMMRARPPDLVILDVMMPSMDGFGVCERIRLDAALKSTPVIMLTARGMTKDRIAGLEQGADDYVPKPFSPKELVLRVQALLRRRHAGSRLQTQHLVGPFRFDVGTQRLAVNGAPVEVTPVEFKLLHLLAQQEGKVVDRDTILREVWHYSDTSQSRTLDTHIRRLRDKLGDARDWVDTERGVGYLLKKPDTA